MAIPNTFTNGTTADADEVNANFTYVEQQLGQLGHLGEIRMFALSMSGAITKASLQGKGWAICDGTTPVNQGITSPTIETTPDLQEKFLRMSNDETSGTTGGSDTHQHESPISVSSPRICWKQDGNVFGTGGTITTDRVASTTGVATHNNASSLVSATSTLPTYYEVAYFMKVKL